MQKKSKTMTLTFDSPRNGQKHSLKIPFKYLYITAAVTLALLILFFAALIRLNQYQSADSTATKRMTKLEREYDDLQNLTDQLNEEISSRQSSISEQTDEYQKELEYFSKKAIELQEKIERLTKDKEEILNELSKISYLPPMGIAASEPIPLGVFASAETSGDPIYQVEAQFTYLDRVLGSHEATFTQLKEEIREAKPLLTNYPSIWPVTGRQTSEFGYRKSPWGTGRTELHSGLDIAVPTGTNIVATGGGVVTFSGRQGGYGYLVIIDHGIGLESYYGHNSKLLVKEGDIVTRGQLIAKSGSTGSSTGPHLHYEVRENGSAVNPRTYLPK